MGKWRRRRGWSTPCCSVSVRPQRRQVVLVSMLSTVRISSLALVSSVWRTRTSGISSGIEISECFGMRSILQYKHESCPHSAPSVFAVQLLYLGAPTASPEEPRFDADLTKEIYRHAPIFVNERDKKSPWGASFKSMFHMSNDSHLF